MGKVMHPLVVVVALLCVPLSLSAAPTTAPADSATASSAGGGLKLDGVTFSDALKYLQDLTNVDFHVNWKAIESAGITKDTIINIHLHNVTLRKALNVVLTEAAGNTDLLTFYIDEHTVEITTREMADKSMITKVYPVEDLLVDVPDFEGPSFNLASSSGGGGGGQGGQGGGGGGGSGSSLFSGDTSQQQSKQPTKAERGQQLIDLIVSIVRPDVWTQNGGTASIRFFNGSLIITAPRSVHEAIQ